MTAGGAFVAGATGYTRRAVVRVLAERGVPVAAHVRPDSPRLTEWHARFAALGAEVDDTPWDADALAATLARRQPTHVFALLGTTRARAKREGTTSPYEAVDYALSSRRSARSHDAAKRYWSATVLT